MKSLIILLLSALIAYTYVSNEPMQKTVDDIVTRVETIINNQE